MPSKVIVNSFTKPSNIKDIKTKQPNAFDS